LPHFQEEQNVNDNKRFFNSKTTGLAFLNEVSEKQSSDGVSLKVKMSELIGPEDKVHYESMVLYVKGEQASNVIQQLRGYLNDSNKVTVSFVAADCKAQAFVVQKGPNVGALRTYQQGSLIFITSARVNGEEVYRAPERETVNG
jgi:hypothetical protein